MDFVSDTKPPGGSRFTNGDRGWIRTTIGGFGVRRPEPLDDSALNWGVTWESNPALSGSQPEVQTTTLETPSFYKMVGIPGIEPSPRASKARMPPQHFIPISLVRARRFERRLRGSEPRFLPIERHPNRKIGVKL